MKPWPRRSFTPEFEAEIVDLCQRGDRSVGQVAIRRLHSSPGYRSPADYEGVLAA
ncbi:hypothetical protein [Streptomyces sp. BBFR109]|uniref:hypothetical protein n=1 Tax=Streptomyces sp. BBFR109 TaxID=3448172 RepID=UPI003F7577F0